MPRKEKGKHSEKKSKQNDLLKIYQVGAQKEKKFFGAAKGEKKREGEGDVDVDLEGDNRLISEESKE